MNRYTLDIGRILLSIIFLGSAATKIADPAGTQAYMAAYGLPMTGPLLIGAIVTELGGGLALLVEEIAGLLAVVTTLHRHVAGSPRSSERTSLLLMGHYDGLRWFLRVRCCGREEGVRRAWGRAS